MNVSALTVAGVAIILYYIFIHVPREQKRRYIMKLGEVHEIYKIMNQVLRNTTAERFLIYQSQNGGGVPRFGVQLYVSVLYEDYTKPLNSVKEKYQRLEADGPYIEMLKRVYDAGETQFFTEDMPEGMMKQLHMREGVLWTYIFKIGQSKTAFYYGSITTSKPETPFQSNSGVNSGEIRLAVNALRQRYKELNETPIRKLKKALYL